MHSLPLPAWNTVIRWSELPGDGPPVLCLPGLSFSAVPNFLPLMTQPPFQGRRCLMVDYVGSGLSGPAPHPGFGLDEHSSAIAAVIEAACDGPVQVLGYSMGGTVAIALALTRLDLVAKLVVCEGNVTPGGGPASRRIANADRATFVATDHPARTNSLAKAALDGDVFAGFLWAARAGADPGALHDSATALVALDPAFQDAFLSLGVERHFVYGEHNFPTAPDMITPDAPDPGRLGAHGIGLHVVPGVGHGMMIDDPVATARVLGPLFTP